MLRNFAKAVRELQRTFGDAFKPYRPELYYMRGPGPAWRAKSAGNVMPTRSVSSDTLALGRLVRARA